jgi:putative ABC transport system permease protein
LGERLRALPGVTAAAAATPLPLDGVRFNSRWGKEDAVTDASKFQQANIHVVLPGYFDAMRTRVLAGRVFDAADNRADALMTVIDRKLAEKAFPGESAVGKRLYIRSRGLQAEWLEIIGVVDHQRHEDLAFDGREAVFVTDGFFGHGTSGTWAVRTACSADTACDPMSIASAARGVVNELDPNVSVSAMTRYTDTVKRAMTPTRFALVLIGIFAGVAVVLACVGLYGVLSTAVRQRTAEIGVRLAFGASRASILGLVIGRGMRLGAIGLALGLVGALLLTRTMETMLIGVRPTDPATYAAIGTLFVALAFVACWLPARRAASLDAAHALKAE